MARSSISPSSSIQPSNSMRSESSNTSRRSRLRSKFGRMRGGDDSSNGSNTQAAAMERRSDVSSIPRGGGALRQSAHSSREEKCEKAMEHMRMALLAFQGKETKEGKKQLEKAYALL